jgi:tetratricopeptide (TPR) repeat protein
VEAALAEEVTDEGHPFGQAVQAYARTHYLAALEAWEPAATVLLDAMQRASSMSRVWMQFNLVGIAVSLGVRAGDLVRDRTSEVEAIAGTAGLRPSGLVRSEVELATGNVTEARDRLERSIAGLAESDPTRIEMSWSLECLTRAYAELGDWDKTLTTADRALELTVRAGQLPLTWRLRGCRAYALDQLGRIDEAAAERAQAADEFDTLANRIADSDLRAWFVRQPLAVRWLGRASEATK